MRGILGLVGVALVVVGCVVLFRGLSYKKNHEIIKVGDIKASVSEKKPIPTWAGGVAVVAGVVMLAGAARTGRR